MWYVPLGWHAVEFARWQHPAMWQVALGLQCHVIRPNVCHIRILLLVSILTISPHVILHQSTKFYPNLTTLSRKKTSCRFSRWWISTILDFRWPIMGSLKSPCTASYKSSIETMALNCSFFWENRVFVFWRQTDRQIYRQTNRWTSPMH